MGLGVLVLAGSLLGCDTLIPWLDGEDQRTLERCTPVASTHGPVGEWEPLGLSGNEIGPIQAVAVNPCNPRVIYAGDRLPGHLFKSIDGGASWDTLFAGSVVDIGIDPYHPDTVYALADGVRKSTDGGSTWKVVFEERGQYEHVSVLELGSKDPETLYLATVEFLEGNLYKSTDGGRNWKELGKEVSGLTDISSLVVSPKARKVVYVGAGEGNIFKSTDAGSAWELIGVRNTNSDVRDLSIVPGQPTLIYAAVEKEGTVRSEDGGESWHSFNKGLPEKGLPVHFERGAGEQFLAYTRKDSGQLYRRGKGSGMGWMPFGIDSLRNQSHYRSGLDL